MSNLMELENKREQAWAKVAKNEARIRRLADTGKPEEAPDYIVVRELAHIVLGELNYRASGEQT